MRAMHLVSLALLVCIASSGLAWLAALAPGLAGLVTFIYAFTGVVWVSCWLLDEPVQQYLGLDETSYQALLIGFAIAVVLGGMARLCLTWLG